MRKLTILFALCFTVSVGAESIATSFRALTPELRAMVNKPGLAYCKGKAASCEYALEKVFDKHKYYVITTPAKTSRIVQDPDTLKSCLADFQEEVAKREPELARLPKWKMQAVLMGDGRDYCFRIALDRLFQANVGAIGSKILDIGIQGQLIIRNNLGSVVLFPDAQGKITHAVTKMAPGFEEWVIYLNDDGTASHIRRDTSDFKTHGTLKRQFIYPDDGSFGTKITKTIFFVPGKYRDKAQGLLCMDRVEHDINRNGRVDRWEFCESCSIVRMEYDENENGINERIIYYDHKGKYLREWALGAESIQRARESAEAENYLRAIEHYETARSELAKEWGPDSSQVCNSLQEIGQTHTLAKQYSQAISVFRQALGLRHCRKNARDEIGLGLLSAVAYSGDSQGIVSTGTEVAQLYAAAHNGRKDAAIEGFLAYGYGRLKRYQPAYEHSRVAIKLELANQKESCSGTGECSFFNPWHFSLFAEACAHLGRISESLALFRQALAFRSRLPAAQIDSFEFSLAYLTYLSGDPNKAIVLNDRFLRDKQRRAFAFGNHALFYLALGDAQKASHLIKTAVSAGLKRQDWEDDIEMFKKHFPARSHLLPALLKASGQFP